MILLRLLNLLLLLGLVVCLAGAMAGLIVFAPFVGGAWVLTLIAIVGSDPDSAARQRRTILVPATHPVNGSAPAVGSPKPTPSPLSHEPRTRAANATYRRRPASTTP
jgi:hypothetical protein